MSENSQIPEQLKWHQRALLAGLVFFVRLWGRTLRYHWDADVQSIMDAETPPAVVEAREVNGARRRRAGTKQPPIAYVVDGWDTRMQATHG